VSSSLKSTCLCIPNTTHVVRHGGGKAEGKWIQNSQCTCLLHLDALRKPSGCLFHDFLLPFGSLLAPFGRLGRPFLDPGTTPGAFRARGAKSCEKITIRLNFGGPRGTQFETVLVKLMTFQRLVFCCFLGSHFAHELQFRGPFGVQFAMLFGVPGTFGNRLKTLKGIRFSHFGAAFCRYGFQAGSGGGLVVDFS
jgi:hypothetical protein